MSATLFKFANESDMHLTAMCLRLGADLFDKDAVAARELPGQAYESLARQFEDQSARARATATALEDSDGDADPADEVQS